VALGTCQLVSLGRKTEVVDRVPFAQIHHSPPLNILLTLPVPVVRVHHLDVSSVVAADTGFRDFLRLLELFLQLSKPSMVYGRLMPL
jgi:hypothetical protein